MKGLLLLVLAFSMSFLTGCGGSQESIKLTFSGDVLLSRGVGQLLESEGYNYPYEKVSTLFKDDDFTWVNLECPLTRAENPAYKDRKILFKADTDNVVAMKENGIEGVNLANNHVMDYRSEGLSEMLLLLQEHGIAWAGAGDDHAAAHQVFITSLKGKKIGFLSYSMFPPEGYIHRSDKADVAFWDAETGYDQVTEARLQCDYLIVSMHWGQEYSRYASETQQGIGRALIDAGADAVIGHHPHVLQGVEKYKGKMIFYSLGNFVFDRQIQKGTDETVLLQLTLSDTSETWTLLPFIIQDCQPAPATMDQGNAILQSISDRSNKDVTFQYVNQQWLIQ